MRLLHLFVFATLIFGGCGSSNDATGQGSDAQGGLPADTDLSFVKSVDADEFRKLVEAGNGTILDVRTRAEYNGGHIENASLVDINDADFSGKINVINKDKDIYVYCLSGARSTAAVDILRKNGFRRIYHLSNGIMEWRRKNLPLSSEVTAADEHIKTMTVNEFNQLLNTNKPVLVDFHTVWCAPCKKMAPIIDKLEKEFGDDAVVVRIDVDRSRGLGAAYDIAGVPVFILFKQGEAVWQHKGLIAEDELRSVIVRNK